jgi:hypothetical protein
MAPAARTGAILLRREQMIDLRVGAQPYARRERDEAG